MKISIEQYTRALYESLREVSEKDHDTVIDNLITVLKQNNDLEKFPAIVEAYEAKEIAESGIKHASLTTATPQKIDKGLMDTLNQLAGQKVTIEQKVDESIIGGVVVRVDDTLVDASIKSQLDQLKRTLSQN